MQEWLSDEGSGASRMVFVTEGAVAVGAGESVDGDGDGGGVGGLVLSAVWGLVRSAEAENPGRFVLVDVDGVDGSWGVLAGALGLGESELAIRGGEVFASRLERAGVGDGVGDGGWFRVGAIRVGVWFRRVTVLVLVLVLVGVRCW